MRYKVTLSSETDINNEEWIYVRIYNDKGLIQESKCFLGSEIVEAQQTYDNWVEFLTTNDDLRKKVELKSTIIE